MRSLLLACIVALAGCQSSTPEVKPKILVSIPPFQSMVERLAGDAVQVQLLVPPGACPHDYEPTPRDIERALSASLWLRLGEPFEEKIVALFKSRSVDASEGLDLLPGPDRHIWLSPKLSLLLVEEFSRELQHLLPQEAKTIQAHAEALTEELRAYDLEFERLLAPHRGKLLITSHPAFGYLCHDYGLVQISLESEGKEAPPRQVESLAEKISKGDVIGIVTEGQYPSRAARFLGKKWNLPLHSINPYAPDYMERLSKLLNECLEES